MDEAADCTSLCRESIRACPIAVKCARTKLHPSVFGPKKAKRCCKKETGRAIIDGPRKKHHWDLEWIQKIARQTLRCWIGRSSVGHSYREFSTRLADSLLLQHFCGFDTLGPIRISSKSTLERNEKKLPEGVIVDWKLCCDGVPSDATALIESLERTRGNYEGWEPEAVVEDTRFSSPRSRGYLDGRDIQDSTCPRSVPQLRFRMEDGEFREHQSRRAQTEGRIGILKNQFLCQPLRSKGFTFRKLSVEWAVLAHDPWVLARLPRAAAEREQQAS